MKSVAGFSLIEVILATVIVGILLAVGVPSYQQQLLQSRRQAVQSQLMQLHLQQQSHRLQHPSYAQLSELRLPTNAYYRFTVTNVSGLGYRLHGIAKQGSSQQADSGCTQLTVNQTLQTQPLQCW